MSATTLRACLAALAVALLGAAGGLACDGKLADPGRAESEADADIDAASSDSGTGTTGECVLRAGRCGLTAEMGCCSSGAYRIDLDRNCRAVTMTDFSCQQSAAPLSKVKCPHAGETSCFSRPLDGGASTDGGDAGVSNASVEVYSSPYYLHGVEGYEDCDGVMAQRAMAASVRPCPQ